MQQVSTLTKEDIVFSSLAEVGVHVSGYVWWN